MQSRPAAFAISLATIAILLVGCVGAAIDQSASPPTAQPLPSDKQRIEDAYASMEASGAAVAPSKDPDAGFVSIPPDPSPYSPYKQSPAGNGVLVQSDLGPPGTPDGTFTNDWFETTRSGITEVYAGALLSDPSQGLAFFVTWDADHASIISSSVVLSAGHDGALTITGADGQVLDLRAEDGTLYKFDAATGSFE
jgi:hypothetical protein